MKKTDNENVCALLGAVPVRPIQLTPILPKEDKSYHLGIHLSTDEHEALRRGMSALTLQGIPMNKSSFVRFAIRATADAYAPVRIEKTASTPTE